MPVQSVPPSLRPIPRHRPPRRPNYALRRAVAAVLAVAALIVVLTVLRGAWNLAVGGGGEDTVAPTTTVPVPAEAPTTTAPPPVVVFPRHNDLTQPPTFPPRDPPLRAVSPAEPLTIWTIGDSTAQALGELLEVDFAGTPLVTTRTVHRNSSGLTRADFYDWPAAIGGVLAEGPPDAVVLSLGDNDAQPLQPEGSPAYVEVGSPEWAAEYARRLRSFVGQITATGSRVYLVGQPTMRDPGFDARIAEVDRAYRELAAADTALTYVDSRALLGDDAGAYTDTLPGAGGEPVRVRSEDGVHVSLEGARWMATVVGRMIAADHGVDAP